MPHHPAGRKNLGKMCTILPCTCAVEYSRTTCANFASRSAMIKILAIVPAFWPCRLSLAQPQFFASGSSHKAALKPLLPLALASFVHLMSQQNTLISKACSASIGFGCFIVPALPFFFLPLGGHARRSRLQEQHTRLAAGSAAFA